MIDLERIDDLCHRLALGTMATQLTHVAEEAVRKEWSYREFFERLLQAEHRERQERRSADAERAGLPGVAVSFWSEPGGSSDEPRRGTGGKVRSKVAGPLIECVANFSEGRDRAAVAAIEGAVRSVADVRVLRSEMDADHNRSVITFVGPPDAVAKGALRGIEIAIERIDLRKHAGVHPRMGAADVVPFVPLEGATLADCVAIARRTGEEVWNRFKVPVYFYESAALSPDRRLLENCRRGGFESPRIAPDVGGPALHPSAGACIIGARKLLIAFNVNLKTGDVRVAREIARKIRASSGGMPFVKALGLSLAERGLVQVSMNLTDFEQTPLHQVFDAVRREAAARGVEIAGSEIIGLMPKKALEDAAAHYLQCENFDSGLVLENRLAEG